MDRNRKFYEERKDKYVFELWIGHDVYIRHFRPELMRGIFAGSWMSVPFPHSNETVFMFKEQFDYDKMTNLVKHYCENSSSS